MSRVQASPPSPYPAAKQKRNTVCDMYVCVRVFMLICEVPVRRISRSSLALTSPEPEDCVLHMRAVWGRRRGPRSSEGPRRPRLRLTRSCPLRTGSTCHWRRSLSRRRRRSLPRCSRRTCSRPRPRHRRRCPRSRRHRPARWRRHRDRHRASLRPRHLPPSKGSQHSCRMVERRVEHSAIRRVEGSRGCSVGNWGCKEAVSLNVERSPEKV